MALRHGQHGTPTYQTWICMRQRCLNPKAADYPRYGGRGIKICPEWQASFLAFYQDMGERPEKKTLDRIVTNGDYCKSNCRWASAQGQIRNTRVNRCIEFDGETKCLVEWAEALGIPSGTISARIRRGWSVEQALTTTTVRAQLGVAHNQRLITFNGETHNIKEWAAIAGMNHHTLHQRLTRHRMPFEEAITRPVGNNGRKNRD